MELLYLVAGFTLGVLLMSLRDKPKKYERDDNTQEILVKRNKPSFSNPMRTTRTAYERYKTRDSGLYAPVKPKGETKDSIDLGR